MCCATATDQCVVAAGRLAEAGEASPNMQAQTAALAAAGRYHTTRGTAFTGRNGLRELGCCADGAQHLLGADRVRAVRNALRLLLRLQTRR